MRKSIACVIVSAATLLAGCAVSGFDSGVGFTLGEVAGEWQLDVLDDRDASRFKVRLQIDAQSSRLTGFDGCGSLEGDLTIEQNRLQVARMNPTVECSGRARAVRDAVRLVLGAGGRMLSVTREGDPMLVLEGVGHALLLVRP